MTEKLLSSLCCSGIFGLDSHSVSTAKATHPAGKLDWGSSSATSAFQLCDFGQPFCGCLEPQFSHMYIGLLERLKESAYKSTQVWDSHAQLWWDMKLKKKSLKKENQDIVP